MEVNTSVVNDPSISFLSPKPSVRFKARQKRADSRKRSNMLDLKKIRAWAQVGCTHDEIALMLGCSADWLEQQIAKDGDLEEAILVGFTEFKKSLRSTQARLALSGHPGMLVWLGKQYLNQAEKQESKSETTVNVVLQKAMQEVREMSKEDLLAMKEIFEKKREPLLIDNNTAE